MHAIQGAMAIRRERQKREQRRQSQIRRMSGKTATPRNSESVSGDIESPVPEPPKAPKADTSMTAFHLGVVFILLGFLMVFSAMIITNSMEGKDWSSLLGAGVTFIIVGLIMVMVNRIISAREEEELAKYVSGRLARTRSGYHIGRDLDAGAEQQHLRVPRRAMSARVPPTRSPSVQIKRSASARRSMRGSRTLGITVSDPHPLSRSPSTYSHLSVNKNCNNIPPPSYEDAVTTCTPTNGITVTETVTETVCESKNNVPALTVTKQRPSSKRGRRTSDDKVEHQS